MRAHSHSQHNKSNILDHSDSHRIGAHFDLRKSQDFHCAHSCAAHKRLDWMSSRDTRRQNTNRTFRSILKQWLFAAVADSHHLAPHRSARSKRSACASQIAQKLLRGSVYIISSSQAESIQARHPPVRSNLILIETALSRRCSPTRVRGAVHSRRAHVARC